MASVDEVIRSVEEALQVRLGERPTADRDSAVGGGTRAVHSKQICDGTSPNVRSHSAYHACRWFLT
jgi:hypothetical protein